MKPGNLMLRILTLYLPLLFAFLANTLEASQVEFSMLHKLPVLEDGRYTPLEVYSKHIFENLSGENVNNPVEQALHLHIFGYEQLGSVPIFLVKDKEMRKILHVHDDQMHLSYITLKEKIYGDKKINRHLLEPVIVHSFWNAYNKEGKSRLELRSLQPGLVVKVSDTDTLAILRVPENPLFHYLQEDDIISLSKYSPKQAKSLSEKTLSLLERISVFEQHPPLDGDGYFNLYESLIQSGKSNNEISKILNTTYPQGQRIHAVASTFLMLPDKFTPYKWHPLRALGLQVYNTKTNTMSLIENFTVYTDEQFSEIQESYLRFVEALKNKSLTKQNVEDLATSLKNSYSSIENTPYQTTLNKTLTFPSQLKLSVESYYGKIPWSTLLIIGYMSSIVFLVLISGRLTYLPLLLTFLIHTSALLLRSYLLGRPPVSNMTETVLFVPWVAVLVSGILVLIYRSKAPLIYSSMGASLLFITLNLSGMDTGMENVQAVLDSQFWLTIHVLMVVGSYGAFLLAGLMGHSYLILSSLRRPSSSLTTLSKLTLQSMYIGLALLIPGTILGGVWAAQSWGRFWDWDPKESWAFISCCTYLIIVHAHYFGVIKKYGIAVGSIIGLMVIAFTWYGVNYVLGTGLHSYGFGSGGEHYFYIYLLVETIFLVLNAFFHYNKRPSSA